MMNTALALAKITGAEPSVNAPFKVIQTGEMQQIVWDESTLGARPSAAAIETAWAACQTEWEARARQTAILSQLRELDLSIPRGLEDFWAQTGFDTTTLPQALQEKLALKLELREEYTALDNAQETDNA